MRHHTALLVAMVLLVVAGCSSAGSSASGPASLAPDPTVSPPPVVSDPNDPIGTDLPPGSNPGGAPAPTGRLAVPKPGQLDVHPFSADTLSAAVDGRHVVLTIVFAIGVEPCAILDTILVQRGPKSFAVTLRQGHGPGDTVCIMIAEVRHALVDLGELEPGTYTITETQPAGFLDGKNTFGTSGGATINNPASDVISGRMSCTQGCCRKR